MPNTLREGIEAFLKHSVADSPFLIERYHQNLETQILVHPGVMQDESGRAYVDGEGQKWSDARWPYQAGTSPNYNDRALTYSPGQHCDLIGTSWWDFVTKRSVAVGLDIDVDEGHAESTTTVSTDFLAEIEEKLLRLPYITLVRSKGGKGLHAYVFFDETDQPHAANHHEHKRHALALINKISDDLDYNIGQHVDAKGLILWLWASNIGNGGFQLIRDAECRIGAHDLAAYYKDQYYEPTRSVKGFTDDGKEVSEDVSGAGQQLFSLDEEHKKILKALEATDYEAIWVKDYNMLQTHTYALKMVHEQLGLRGKYETVSSGARTKPNWEKVNCYITPRPDGAFKVVRFGSGVAEHDYWSDIDGKTFCFYNQNVSAIALFRKFAAQTLQNGSMKFERGQLQKAIDLIQDESQTVPEANGPITVKVTKEGGIVCTAKWKDHDGDFWLKYVLPKDDPIANLPENYDVAENVARLLVSEKNDILGWALISNRGWLYPAKENYVSDRLGVIYGKDGQGIRDYLVQNPWTLTNDPFQPEYPGDRIWNFRAPQFKVKPSEEPGPHPSWDRILVHLGRNLDGVVKNTKWCQEWGLESGADYLLYWIAALINHPFEPLPYLFFYGKQETGKSMFHEMLQLIISNGIMRANQALTSGGGFNGEFMDTLLGYIEELDLASYKQAYDKIKEYTTARQIQIHIKQVTPFMQRNKLHFVQMSNSSTHLPIEEGDSRIVVIEVPELAETIPKSILEGMLLKEAPYFLHSLLSVTLPKPLNRLRIPVLSTSAKEDLEKGSLTPVQAFCSEHLFDAVGHSVKVSELFDRYKLYCAEKGMMPESPAVFRNQLSPRWIVGTYTDNQKHVANVSINPRVKPKDKLELTDNGRLSPTTA